MRRLVVVMLSAALLLPVNAFAEPVCGAADDGSLICNPDGAKALMQGIQGLKEANNLLILDNLKLKREAEQAKFELANMPKVEPKPDMTPWIVVSGVVGVLVGVIAGFLICG